MMQTNVLLMSGTFQKNRPTYRFVFSYF